MGYNSETQPSDSMPLKVSLRGGRYYFRIPILKAVKELPNSPYFQIIQRLQTLQLARLKRDKNISSL